MCVPYRYLRCIPEMSVLEGRLLAALHLVWLASFSYYCEFVMPMHA